MTGLNKTQGKIYSKRVKYLPSLFEHRPAFMVILIPKQPMKLWICLILILLSPLVAWADEIDSLEITPLQYFEQQRYRVLEARCQNDASDPCSYALAMLYRYGPADKSNHKYALELWQSIKPESSWYAASLYQQALAIVDGIDKKNTLKNARAYLLTSSALGYYPAAAKAGELLQQGKGGTVDFEEAEWQFRLALLNDETLAYLGLGKLFQQGQGVPLNNALALDLLQKAAARESAEAQYHLGEIYYKGDGITQDFGLAFRNLAAAVKQKYPPAFLRFGMLYYFGQGVEKDMPKACALFTEGSKLGNAATTSVLENLKNQGRCPP